MTNNLPQNQFKRALVAGKTVELDFDATDSLWYVVNPLPLQIFSECN